MTSNHQHHHREKFEKQATSKKFSNSIFVFHYSTPLPRMQLVYQTKTIRKVCDKPHGK
jgi:hypothetical protein